MITSKGKILLIALVVGQSFQIVAGAREFARKVLFSKSGAAVVGILGITAGALYVHPDNVRKEAQDAPEVDLSHFKKSDMYELCERFGCHRVHMVSGSVTGASKITATEAVIYIDALTVGVLDGKPVGATIKDRDGTVQHVFRVNPEHVLKKIEGDLVMQEMRTPVDWVGRLCLPVAILAAKATRVAGRSKIAGAAVGVASWTTMALGLLAGARSCAYRADQAITKNKEDARIVAQNSTLTSPPSATALEALCAVVPAWPERVKRLEEKWGVLELSDPLVQQPEEVKE